MSVLFRFVRPSASLARGSRTADADDTDLLIEVAVVTASGEDTALLIEVAVVLRSDGRRSNRRPSRYDHLRAPAVAPQRLHCAAYDHRHRPGRGLVLTPGFARVAHNHNRFNEILRYITQSRTEITPDEK